MDKNESTEPIERELTDLPHHAMELGAIERIEDALAADAVLGPVVVETKPGLMKRRVPVWGMLAACVLLSCSAGVMGWVLKPVETVERIRVVTEPASVSDQLERESESVIEVVHLERPLFERSGARMGIEPSRWTMGH